MKNFRFIDYNFDLESHTARFVYGFDEAWQFEESVFFDHEIKDHDANALEAAMFYSFIILGISYYKLFPLTSLEVEKGDLNPQQAKFFSDLYRGGLSQFVYENGLTGDSISEFVANVTTEASPIQRQINAQGILLLQSGGKDSLLAAELLKQAGHSFGAWHMSTTGHHPAVINEIGAENVVDVTRKIDLENIREAREAGGLNGHVPFSAITAGLAMISAILSGKNTIIAAMEASSDEPNTVMSDGFEVNHMYSKTFDFELKLNDYIHQNIATDLNYLSLIRPFGDLRVSELFAQKAWAKYKNGFSSCNVSNYKQGEDTGGKLTWCGNCPKCANSFLLFAPFVDYDDLTSLFDGRNLFASENLQPLFKALLGEEGVKPFECVGTVDELRQAYKMAVERDQRYDQLSFIPKPPQEDFRKIHPSQEITKKLLPNGMI